MHKTKFALKMLAAVFAVLVISSPALADEKPDIFVQLGQTDVKAMDISQEISYLRKLYKYKALGNCYRTRNKNF